MLTIDRRCSYRLITRALELENQALVAVLEPGADDWETVDDAGRLAELLAAEPESAVVYNQQQGAIELVESLEYSERQLFIEIRQDTKGVLGLHAIRNRGPDAITEELIYR